MARVVCPSCARSILSVAALDGVTPCKGDVLICGACAEVSVVMDPQAMQLMAYPVEWLPLFVQERVRDVQRVTREHWASCNPV